MAKTTAGVVAIVAALAPGLATRIDASPGPELVVVLHLTDDANVSKGVLAEAERQAARVYHAAGVQTVWTGGFAGTAQPDGAFHLDVVIRSRDMKNGQSEPEVTDGEVLGRSSRPTRRAHIFYVRVFDYARKTGSNVANVLGAVIAHEVGHLLLPAFSHSPSGIMSARWEGRMVRVPDFTVDQGTMIRSLLATAPAK